MLQNFQAMLQLRKLGAGGGGVWDEQGEPLVLGVVGRAWPRAPQQALALALALGLPGLTRFDFAGTV